MSKRHYRLLFDDLVAAARLHQVAAFFAWRSLVALAGLAFLSFVVIVFALAARGDAPGKDAIPGALIVAATPIVYFAAAFVVGRWLLVPRGVRRVLAEQKNLQHDFAIEVKEQSCSVSGPTIQSDTPWGDYLKWRENDRVLLLYISSNYYQVIPKGLLQLEVVDAIRRRLIDAGVEEAPLLLE